MISKQKGLITICKAFNCPYLNYWNRFYNKVFNVSFHQKIESFSYNACKATTGAIIRGTSREKFCQELDLESLQVQRWYQNLCHFCKLCNKLLYYLLQIILSKNPHRYLGNISFFKFYHNLNSVIILSKTIVVVHYYWMRKVISCSQKCRQL